MDEFQSVDREEDFVTIGIGGENNEDFQTFPEIQDSDNFLLVHAEQLGLDDPQNQLGHIWVVAPSPDPPVAVARPPVRVEKPDLLTLSRGSRKKRGRKTNEEKRKLQEKENRGDEDGAVCFVCRLPFRSQAEVKKHLAVVHSKEKIHMCKLCPQMYNVELDRMMHERSVHNRESEALPTSEVTEKEISRYGCVKCDLDFATVKALREHLGSHSKVAKEALLKVKKKRRTVGTGKKDLACRTCGKRFQKRSLLVRHERIHTGEKPFKCKLCEKDFSQSNTLTLHMRVHDDFRPFKCDKCEAAFTQKGNLMTHMGNVHFNVENTSVSCGTCNRHFKTVNSLSAHHTKAHPGVKVPNSLYTFQLPDTYNDITIFADSHRTTTESPQELFPATDETESTVHVGSESTAPHGVRKSERQVLVLHGSHFKTDGANPGSEAATSIVSVAVEGALDSKQSFAELPQVLVVEGSLLKTVGVDPGLDLPPSLVSATVRRDQDSTHCSEEPKEGNLGFENRQQAALTPLHSQGSSVENPVPLRILSIPENVRFDSVTQTITVSSVGSLFQEENQFRLPENGKQSVATSENFIMGTVDAQPLTELYPGGLQAGNSVIMPEFLSLRPGSLCLPHSEAVSFPSGAQTPKFLESGGGLLDATEKLDAGLAKSRAEPKSSPGRQSANSAISPHLVLYNQVVSGTELVSNEFRKQRPIRPKPDQRTEEVDMPARLRTSSKPKAKRQKLELSGEGPKTTKPSTDPLLTTDPSAKEALEVENIINSAPEAEIAILDRLLANKSKDKPSDRSPDVPTTRVLTDPVTKRTHETGLVVENGIKFSACLQCRKKFKKPIDLIRHLRTHYKEKPFQCSMCSYAFSVKKSLDDHLLTHFEPTLECATCGKKFATLKALNSHVLSYCKDPSKCAVCDFTSKEKTEMTKHMEEHRRSAAKVLERPIRIEDGDPPSKEPGKVSLRKYFCSICAATFARSNHLEQHTRSHNNDRPFKCTLCDKAFFTKNLLRKHTKRHETGQNLTCKFDGCSKSFHNQEYLKKHEMAEHGEKKYLCPYCQEMYITQRACQRHILTHLREVIGKESMPRNLLQASKVVTLLTGPSTEEDAAERYACVYCEEIFTSETGFKKHALTHKREAAEGDNRDMSRDVNAQEVTVLPNYPGGCPISDDADSVVEACDVLAVRGARDQSENQDNPVHVGDLSEQQGLEETRIVRSSSVARVIDVEWIADEEVQETIYPEPESPVRNLPETSQFRCSQRFRWPSKAPKILRAYPPKKRPDLRKEIRQGPISGSESVRLGGTTKLAGNPSEPSVRIQILSQHSYIPDNPLDKTEGYPASEFRPETDEVVEEYNPELSYLEESEHYIILDDENQLTDEYIELHTNIDQNNEMALLNGESDGYVVFIDENNQPLDQANIFFDDTADHVMMTEPAVLETTEIPAQEEVPPSHLIEDKHVLSVVDDEKDVTWDVKSLKAKKAVYKCRQCNRRFTHKKFKLHKANPEECVTTCKFCAVRFRSSAALAKHVEKAHSTKTCLICSAEFINAGYFAQHVERHKANGENIFTCCKKAFRDYECFTDHFVTAHSSQPTPGPAFVTVEIPSVSTAESTSLPTQLEITLPPPEEAKNTCRECNRKFKKPSDLIRHRATHLSVKEFTCDICDKRFSYKSSLVSHKKMHPSAKVQCRLCGHRCYTTSELRNHEGECAGYALQQETPLTGNFGLEKRPEMLHYDMQLDDRDQMVVDMDCGLYEDFPDMVIQPGLIHDEDVTAEEPAEPLCPVRKDTAGGFECVQCGAAFSRKATLLRHERVHSGKRPFECSECSARFPHKHALDVHFRVHSGEKPYSCPFCDYKGTQLSNVRTHVTKTHGVDGKMMKATSYKSTVAPVVVDDTT